MRMVSCKEEILLKTDQVVWTDLVNRGQRKEYVWSRLHDGVWRGMGFMPHEIEFELRS